MKAGHVVQNRIQHVLRATISHDSFLTSSVLVNRTIHLAVVNRVVFETDVSSSFLGARGYWVTSWQVGIVDAERSMAF